MPIALIISAQYFGGFFLTYFLYAKAFNIEPESREATALTILCVAWPVPLFLLSIIAIFVAVDWLQEIIEQWVKR